uniref:Uncharacterized protein n=1 Tax=Magallana gigas TaxID=29159 RepID=K1PXS7_MAGGI
MASKEVPRPKEYAESETGFSTVQPTLKQHLDNATAALLFKNFDACIEHCENGLSRVKLCTDRENFSSKEYTEQLCVLAVQAHAERNTWQEVLPFVQKVYGDIEHSPAAIVQLWWVEQAVYYIIWIVGSSIIKNAFCHAKESCRGTDLQLDRHKASIFWQGKGGMRWAELYSKIKTLLKVEDPPQILVIHCGGNNIPRQYGAKSIELRFGTLYYQNLGKTF